jgi:WD40 repeat protein
MIWDIRTGKGILPILGHQKSILGADFSSNGFIFATGG